MLTSQVVIITYKMKNEEQEFSQDLSNVFYAYYGNYLTCFDIGWVVCALSTTSKVTIMFFIGKKGKEN